MKRIIPYLIPSCTTLVCHPSKVASLAISLHQTNIENRVVNSPSRKVSHP